MDQGIVIVKDPIYLVKGASALCTMYVALRRELCKARV